METEISTLNPLDGTLLSRFRLDSEAEIEKKLQLSHQAFLKWREESMASRSEKLVSLAKVFRKNAEAMSLMITREMGKPIRQSQAEIEKCASVCEWVAENSHLYLKNEDVSYPDARVEVSFRPLGSVLAVMPWNFPFWQVMRAAASLVAGGNPVVLKHAGQVLGCAQMLAESFREADFENGVFTLINSNHQQIEKIIADRRITGVTVTGSGGAGRKIASIAGANLKKCVLELGGSDAFIVLSDVNIDAVAAEAVTARFQNTGQVCIAAKRFIVDTSIFDSFQEAFVEKVRKLTVGDPSKESTDVGPMARFDLRDELSAQVKKTVAAGAKLIYEGGFGEDPDLQRGSFFGPTVLSEVSPSMVSFREEMFGPVASLVRANDTDHAVHLANQSDFGLCGSIWCGPNSLERALELTKRLEVGGAFINKVPFTHPAIPVGGIKESGFGRELSSLGLREFMNVQTVWRV